MFSVIQLPQLGRSTLSNFHNYLIKSLSSTQLDPQKASSATAPMRTAAQVYAAKNGEISLIAPAPTIKNLALSGGGASGWILPHALAQMENKFENIAGCSAGGLVGSLLASGWTAAEVDENLSQITLPSLLGSISDFETLYPTVALIPEKLYPRFLNILAYIGRMSIMKIIMRGWQKTAESMVQMLDKWSAQSVSKHLKNPEIWQKVEDAHHHGRLDKPAIERLVFLKENRWFDKPCNLHTARTEHMITFKDLAVLHSIAPLIFKKLTLVSSQVMKQVDKNIPSALEVTKKFFNAEETPDVPIAIAARASMSLPFYFQDVWYLDASYKDGGMTSRIPAEVFLPKDASTSGNYIVDAHKQAETATIIFGNRKYKKEIDQILYKVPLPGPNTSFLNQVAQWFSNYPKHSEMAAEDNRKLYQAGPNVFIVDNGNIDTFNMFAPQKDIDEAKKLATIHMQEQLALRKNQAYYLSFKTVYEAWTSLNEEQQAAVRKAVNPELESDFETLSEHTQAAQRAFYVLAQQNSQTSTLHSSLTNHMTVSNMA